MQMRDEVVNCECGSKMYPYTDSRHIILLCFKCGRFEGVSGGDMTFIKAVTEEPLIILDMLDDGVLKPFDPIHE